MLAQNVVACYMKVFIRMPVPESSSSPQADQAGIGIGLQVGGSAAPAQLRQARYEAMDALPSGPVPALYAAYGINRSIGATCGSQSPGIRVPRRARRRQWRRALGRGPCG